MFQKLKKKLKRRNSDTAGRLSHLAFARTLSPASELIRNIHHQFLKVAHVRSFFVGNESFLVECLKADLKIKIQSEFFFYVSEKYSVDLNSWIEKHGLGNRLSDYLIRNQAIPYSTLAKPKSKINDSLENHCRKTEFDEIRLIQQRNAVSCAQPITPNLNTGIISNYSYFWRLLQNPLIAYLWSPSLPQPTISSSNRNSILVEKPKEDNSNYKETPNQTVKKLIGKDIDIFEIEDENSGDKRNNSINEKKTKKLKSTEIISIDEEVPKSNLNTREDFEKLFSTIMSKTKI